MNFRVIVPAALLSMRACCGLAFLYPAFDALEAFPLVGHFSPTSVGALPLVCPAWNSHLRAAPIIAGMAAHLSACLVQL